LTAPRSAEAEAIGPPSTDAVTAVAAFLQDHPERIRSVARRLQDAERLFESRVAGSSMGRQLPEGAPVRIQLCRREAYEPGTVVAYQVGARVIAHRVVSCGTVGRRRGVVIARGDARLFPDLPFDVSSVLGAVVAVQTERGWNPPESAPDGPLAQRAIARTWQAVAWILCGFGLRFARRTLGFLHFAGRTAARSAAFMGRADAARSGAPRARSRSS
jgi:hypothetical protein